MARSPPSPPVPGRSNRITATTDWSTPRNNLRPTNPPAPAKGLFASPRNAAAAGPTPAFLPTHPASQEIRGPDGGVVHFDVDPFKKHCLLNGLDEIGLTLEKADKIAAYENGAAAARPWV